VRKLIVVVLLLVMLPVLACSFSLGAGSEPGLKTAVVCQDLSADYEPVGPTDVFSQDQDFYVSVQYSGLEEGQVIGIEWFFEDESLYKVTVPLEAGNAGDAYAGFTLTNSDPWPVGNYHADISLDGEFDHAVEFLVQ
jgi:hypothetical protein